MYLTWCLRYGRRDLPARPSEASTAGPIRADVVLRTRRGHDWEVRREDITHSETNRVLGQEATCVPVKRTKQHAIGAARESIV